MISEYIANVSIMNKLTTNEFYARLDIFRIFAEAKYSYTKMTLFPRLRTRKIPIFF
jgi:hypothetical protein